MYRDIKPDNIGFDVRGDVKIFDFGLAKEFDRTKAVDGTYRFTGDTGSPRYMAPEVALGKPYNESVDVYSFSILTWEILQLEKPFSGYSMDTLTKKVVEGGHRPKCDDNWPASVKDILARGWHAQISKRCSMDEMYAAFQDEISKNSDEEIHDLIDASRKSEMSLRQQSAQQR
jgi:serine/threonine protein kinase